jgi:hypothetical protein
LVLFFSLAGCVGVLRSCRRGYYLVVVSSLAICHLCLVRMEPTGPALLRPWSPMDDRWEPSASSSFYVPSSADDCTQVRTWAADILMDGEIVPVRGRDIVGEPYVGDGPLAFGAWEYGMALKYKRRFFFLWPQKVESLDNRLPFSPHFASSCCHKRWRAA